MKIVIQGYWGAEVASIKASLKHVAPEDYLKNNPTIVICDIGIDKKFVGSVVWDGKDLRVIKGLKQKKKHADKEES